MNASKQVNFNSVILLCIGALITFGLKKLDEINTNVVKLHVRVDYLESRVSSFETVIRSRTP